MYDLIGAARNILCIGGWCTLAMAGMVLQNSPRALLSGKQRKRCLNFDQKE